MQAFESVQNLHTNLDSCLDRKFAFASFPKKKFQAGTQLFYNQKVVALVRRSVRNEFRETFEVLEKFENLKLDQGIVVLAHLHLDAFYGLLWNDN